MTDQPLSSDSKLFAAVSYISLLSVVILVLKKGDEYVQFHAKQGTVIFAASIIFWLIPVVGWIVNILVLIIMIIGFVKAYQGERYRFPVIADLAEKIKI